MSVEELEDKKKLEKYYKDNLKEFAKHYVAIWNALKSLGLTDPQVKGAISCILENSGGTMKDTRQEIKFSDDFWKEIMKNRERN